MNLKNTLFVLAALIIITASTDEPECKPHSAYTQSMLALSWPYSFNARKYATLQQLPEWNGHTFSIHGYWPTYDSEDINCLLLKNQPDPFCRSDLQYDESRFDKELISSLQTYWPQWGAHHINKFRQHQWNKHGVCYLNLTKQKYGDTYSDEQIFYGYFMQAVLKAKLHVFVSKFKFETKEDLRQQLRIPSEKNFYIICDDDHKSSIKEVRICYNLAEPGAETYAECFDRYLNNFKEPCIYPVHLQLSQETSIQVVEEASSESKSAQEL